jgi:hypothetical protein
MNCRAAKPLPSLELLDRLLQYDPETGRLISRGNPRTVAGYVYPKTTKIRIEGQAYGQHRLIFKIVHRVEPPPLVDHRDRVSTHNRSENLRAATRSQNGQNAKTSARSHTGFKGVSFKRGRRKPYWAHRGSESLGYYTTAEEAHAVYSKRIREVYGEFAYDGL